MSLPRKKTEIDRLDKQRRDRMRKDLASANESVRCELRRWLKTLSEDQIDELYDISMESKGEVGLRTSELDDNQIVAVERNDQDDAENLSDDARSKVRFMRRARAYFRSELAKFRSKFGVSVLSDILTTALNHGSSQYIYSVEVASSLQNALGLDDLPTQRQVRIWLGLEIKAIRLACEACVEHYQRALKRRGVSSDTALERCRRLFDSDRALRRVIHQVETDHLPRWKKPPQVVRKNIEK